MGKLTYDNKVTLVSQPDVANENKVTASDMNQIKTIVNGNDDNFSHISTYSTSETATDMTWIDGKTIYRKVYTGTTTVGGQYTTVDSSFSGNIIKFEGTVINKSNNTTYPLVGENGSNGDFIFPYFQNTKIQLLNYNSKKTFDYILIIEYTKSS